MPIGLSGAKLKLQRYIQHKSVVIHLHVLVMQQAFNILSGLACVFKSGYNYSLTQLIILYYYSVHTLLKYPTQQQQTRHIILSVRQSPSDTTEFLSIQSYYCFAFLVLT